MIVAKAVKMAEIMDIPILGVVENMAYFECPNCDTKHNIYGDSHIEQILKEHHIDVMSKIPIDPKIAELSDKGEIEEYNVQILDDICNVLEIL